MPLRPRGIGVPLEEPVFRAHGVRVAELEGRGRAVPAVAVEGGQEGVRAGGRVPETGDVVVVEHRAGRREDVAQQHVHGRGGGAHPGAAHVRRRDRRAAHRLQHPRGGRLARPLREDDLPPRTALGVPRPFEGEGQCADGAALLADLPSEPPLDDDGAGIGANGPAGAAAHADGDDRVADGRVGEEHDAGAVVHADAVAHPEAHGPPPVFVEVRGIDGHREDAAVWPPRRRDEEPPRPRAALADGPHRERRPHGAVRDEQRDLAVPAEPHAVREWPRLRRARERLHALDPHRARERHRRDRHVSEDDAAPGRVHRDPVLQVRQQDGRGTERGVRDDGEVGRAALGPQRPRQDHRAARSEEDHRRVLSHLPTIARAPCPCQRCPLPAHSRESP